MDNNFSVSTNKDAKIPEVKHNGKGKKSFLRRFSAFLLLFVFIGSLIGFTVINYLIHLNDYEDKFKYEPSSEILFSYIKPLLLEGEAKISEDDINMLLAYEVKENAQSFVVKNGLTINNASLNLLGNNKLTLYVKFTDKNTKVLKANASFSFNKEEQAIQFIVSDVWIGRLHIPNFLLNKFLSKINTGKSLSIKDRTVTLPLTLANSGKASSNKEPIISINSLSITEKGAVLKADKPFEKELESFKRILGTNSELVLGSLIDTTVNSCKSNDIGELISKCVYDIKEKFAD